MLCSCLSPCDVVACGMAEQVWCLMVKGLGKATRQVLCRQRLGCSRGASHFSLPAHTVRHCCVNASRRHASQRTGTCLRWQHITVVLPSSSSGIRTRTCALTLRALSVELQRSPSALCMTGILLTKEHVSTTGRGAVRKEACRPLYDGKNDVRLFGRNKSHCEYFQPDKN